MKTTGIGSQFGVSSSKVAGHLQTFLALNEKFQHTFAQSPEGPSRGECLPSFPTLLQLDSSLL